MCTECSFSNITSSRSGLHLFETHGSFHLYASTLYGVTTNATMIKGAHDSNASGVIWDATNGIRHFTISNCTFSNLYSVDDVIQLDRHENDVK